MKIDVLRRKVANLKREVESRKPVDLSNRPDPVEWAEETIGEPLDPWQQDVLRTQEPRELLLCSRQVGKSFVSALKAAYEPAFNPRAEVIAIAPTLRQSRNLFDRIEHALVNTKPRLKFDTHTRTMIRLKHGGTVRALPGDKPDLVRGLTATHIVIDEAAFVRDTVLTILLPMLATTGGKLTLLSTPSGPSGTFHDAWMSGNEWHRVKVLAKDCPRISASYLAEARRKLGDLAYRQEFLCEFIQASAAFFSAEMIDSAFDNEELGDSRFDDLQLEDFF